MPELLTHALAGYIIGTMLSPWYDWIDKRYVSIMMVGALVPDLNKISLLLGDHLMEVFLGDSFSWVAIHFPAGSLVICCIGALLVGDGYRIPVLGLLSIGVISHFLLDSLSIFTTGFSYPMLWPVWDYYFPALNVFESSDRIPTAVASLAATMTYLLRRRTS